MTARRPRRAILAALLAMLAVLTMSALAGWHAADVHDDPRAVATTVDRDHAGDPQRDPDRAIHVAAHAIGHGVAVPAGVAPPPPRSPAEQAWPAGERVAQVGVAAVDLLRPPRG